MRRELPLCSTETVKNGRTRTRFTLRIKLRPLETLDKDRATARSDSIERMISDPLRPWLIHADEINGAAAVTCE